MTRRGLGVWLLTILCIFPLASCARHFVAHGPVALAVDESLADGELYAQWLGTSAWIISRGRDVVVVDPFFTRPSAWAVASSLLFPGIADGFGYDVTRIRDVLPTAKNILESFQPARLTFVTAGDAQQILIPGGQIRVIPFDSDHAPHFLGITFMSGRVAAPPPSFPTTTGEYPTGETKMYLIDFLDEAGAIQWRVFINSAASTPRRALAMKTHLSQLPVELQRPPDVAILCVPGWNKVADYPESLLRVLKPGIVVLSHYDDFFSPYKNGEDPAVDMRFVMFADYEGFIQRLKELQSTYGFEYRAPKTGQCLRFPGPAGALPCEK